MPWRLSSIFSLLTASYVSAHGLCNSAIDKANASGVLTYQVDYLDPRPKSGGGFIPDPSWAVTVDGGQRTWWYDTAGQNYSNDLYIGYDVCAYIVYRLPLNTVELGQDDPGDCSTVLSQDCIDELTTRAALSANMWTTYSSPPPYQNLTAGVLPTICNNIFGDFGDDGWSFPKQCAKELNYHQGDMSDVGNGVYVQPVPLTGYNESILDTGCPLRDGDKTFHSDWYDSIGEIGGYDRVTRDVTPVLTVYLPPANVDALYSNSASISALKCLRVKHFSEGSRVSPALPAGIPYSHGSISGGTIAGIIVAVLAPTAIFTGLATWFCLRRRKARGHTLEEPKLVDSTGEGEDDSIGLAELSSKSYRQEMDSTELAELSPVERKPMIEADSKYVYELGHGEGKLVELSS